MPASSLSLVVLADSSQAPHPPLEPRPGYLQGDSRHHVGLLPLSAA